MKTITAAAGVAFPASFKDLHRFSIVPIMQDMFEQINIDLYR
jgi:hypothetical protein